MSDDLHGDGVGAGTGSAEVDGRLTDPVFLVNSFSSQVVGLLNGASEPASRLAAAVYRQSVNVHRQAGAAVRRQILALDAARFGDRELAARITAVPVKGEPAARWGVEWATGTGADQRFWPAATGHTGWVTAVATAVVEGRPVAVTGGEDNTVRVWDLATGQPVGEPRTGHTDRVEAVATAVLEDGRPVTVTGGSDGTVRLWDPATGQQVGEPLTGHDGSVRALATSVLDGRPVAVTGSSDGTVRQWELATGRQVGSALVFPDWVAGVALSPDNRMVVGFGHDVAVLARR